MADEGNLKSVLKKIMSNVTKAALKGFIMFLLTYLLPTLVVEAILPSSSPFGMPSEYTTLLYVFSAIVVFFTVVTELFSGTILQHAFCVGRAINSPDSLLCLRTEWRHLCVDFSNSRATASFAYFCQSESFPCLANLY